MTRRAKSERKAAQVKHAAALERRAAQQREADAAGEAMAPSESERAAGVGPSVYRSVRLAERRRIASARADAADAYGFAPEPTAADALGSAGGPHGLAHGLGPTSVDLGRGGDKVFDDSFNAAHGCSGVGRLSIAPMMEVTDQHFRFLMRQLTRKAKVYTEMRVDQTLLYNVHSKNAMEYYLG